MKGKVYEIKQKTKKDPETKVEVTRLSDNKCNTLHPYFTQPLMTADSKKILVSSDKSGSWQHFLLNIDKATMVQLTEENNISTGSPCLDRENMIVYYWAGKTLKSVELSSLKTEKLYSVPESFHPGKLTITSGGRYLDFVYSENLNLSSQDWKENLYRRPSSVIMRFDTRQKEAKAIWGERQWISHVNTSPTDENIVLFCHEGPWHLVQRMWIVRADTGEVWPLVEQEKCRERTGHEIFSASGKVVTQYGYRETPYSKWQNADIFVNPDGTDLKKYNYPGPKPGHIQVNSTETYGVGDRMHKSYDHQDGINYIGLIKYKKEVEELELQPLCRHDTDWSIAHPHPIFAPNDQFVIFDSTREGNTNIYSAPVKY